MVRYILPALLALPLCAQVQPARPLLPQVREYLQLTNAQVLGIVASNDEYNRNIQLRIERIRQVQTEIAAETAKDPLDQAALGVRYAEVELICRDLRDLANSAQTRNLKLLTAEQRTKLKTLEEALKLVPVLGEAQVSNLLAPWNTAPAGLNGYNNFINVQGLGVNAIYGCFGTGFLVLQPAQ